MHGQTEADRRPAPRMSESRKERRTATPEAAATAAVVIDILSHTYGAKLVFRNIGANW